MGLTRKVIRNIIRESINRLYVHDDLENPQIKGKYGSRIISGVYDFFGDVEKTVFSFEGDDGFEECADYLYENKDAFFIPLKVRISFDETVGMGEMCEIEEMDDDYVKSCEEIIDNFPSQNIGKAAKETFDEAGYDFEWEKFESDKSDYTDYQEEY